MLGIGVVKGLLTTFTHLFRKPITIQYPDERMEMPLWTRGRPRLIYELDSGDLRCVACGACAIACPVSVIKIEQHPGPDRKKVLDRFDIDMGGCIECALCVEACPFRALVMAPDFEMAYYDRAESLVFNIQQLRIAGTPEVDAAMEHLLGVKRGFARTGGDQAKEAAPAAAPAPAARPAARPAAAAAAPARPAAPAPAARPAGPPAIDPKELEGLSPAEKAALYKARAREAGIVPPRRGEQPPARTPAAEPQAAAPAPAAPASASGKLEVDAKQLEGMTPAERAALYKARQREAGVVPPKRSEQPPAKAPAPQPAAPAPREPVPATQPERPAPPASDGQPAAAPVKLADGVHIDPKELEGLSPAERAAVYKARQRAAGIAPPGRGQSKG